VKPLTCDLSSFLALRLDDKALAGLEWREVGKGVSIAKLAREDRTGMVLYRIDARAPAGAFFPHRHPGGEAYFVLRGVIADESGRYPEGSFAWLPPDSRHAPRAEGEDETIVLVLWPEGVVREGP